MKILFVEPYDRTLFSFRKELLDELILQGHSIILCTNLTKRVADEYKNKVLEIINVDINLKNKNIFKNHSLLKQYKKIINEKKPELIISYTIKPNIYCGLNSKDIPIITNITGLGNTFKTNNILSKMVIHLYKKAYKNVDYVFFQNEDGYNFFTKNKIPVKNYEIIPGSGVNVEKFNLLPIEDNGKVNFLFASRAIREKGFDLLIQAIPIVLASNKNVHFNFLYAEEEIMKNDQFIKLYNTYPEFISVYDRLDDMTKAYSKNDFIVLPSFYREGISNVLLESLACGRPIITTRDNYGCKEVLQEKINGFGVNSGDLSSLVESLMIASKCSKQQIKEMGLAGRMFVCRLFDRKLVIDSYLRTIRRICGEQK